MIFCMGHGKMLLETLKIKYKSQKSYVILCYMPTLNPDCIIHTPTN